MPPTCPAPPAIAPLSTCSSSLPPLHEPSVESRGSVSRRTITTATITTTTTTITTTTTTTISIADTTTTITFHLSTHKNLPTPALTFSFSFSLHYAVQVALCVWGEGLTFRLEQVISFTCECRGDSRASPSTLDIFDGEKRR
ncbi:hypothetical protein E2C01_045555 [Portunus trituberculatus]|uniref:Uncharacterized protein n=1 Tax=Portunus trituberculatus TaxID=210409 RepID=A0A5B7G368_PORTR|nr:hypothetical protein [Portunus trituberculatus]